MTDTPEDDERNVERQEGLPFDETALRKERHNGEVVFSVVDIIGALVGGHRARKYWSDLKRKLVEKEGFSQLSEKIGQLPMVSHDGRNRLTDVANVETVLRIIQSIPSPRVEPLKQWLARVGYERLQETINPEMAVKRAIAAYQAQGRSDDWIEKRLRTIVVRKELTNEWKARGISDGREYASLTNIIAVETFEGITTAGHKAIKGLGPNQSLRDHMTDLELIFTMLAEKSTVEIAKARDAQDFKENAGAARAGGRLAGEARTKLEKETKQGVVSPNNHLGNRTRAADPQQLTKRKR